MKKKLITLSITCVLLTLNSCEKQTDITINQPNGGQIDSEPMTTEQIDEFMAKQAQKNGNVFDWKTASDEMIWSALKYSDEPILTVGYKSSPSEDVEDNLSTIDIQAPQWQQARNKILSVVFEEERKVNSRIKSVDDVVVYPENTLPNFDLNISSLSTIKKIRELGLIRYMEPVAYRTQAELQSNGKSRIAKALALGCGDKELPTQGLVQGADFTITSPNNTMVSWNLPIHNIPTAWSRGADGTGVKMVYFDTGCSNEQRLMNSLFTAGLSGGRSIERLVTLPRATFLGIPTGAVETPHDPCGHGTASSSVGTAPRSGYSSVGIAYKASVVTVRASNDVVFTRTREFNGVAKAYEDMANRSDVKVISMSMGTSPVPFTLGGAVGLAYYTIYRNKIADAIKLANQKGKLMFCAAGTVNADLVQNLVIFPATMSEVYAVTGVKMLANASGGSRPLADYTNPTECSECFYGADVDFAVVMQKSFEKAQRPLSATRTDFIGPSTFGGSSVATASMSAMATAIWSKYPTLSREALIDRLRMSATHGFSRHSKFGWGLVDMEKATR